jgi:hypothetical protein
VKELRIRTMGIRDRIRAIQRRLVRAYEAYRGIPPAQLTEEPGEDEDEDTELDEVFGNEDDRQRDEVADALQHDLDADLNTLEDAMRRGNGDKKA